MEIGKKVTYVKLHGILRSRLRCAACGDMIALHGNRYLTDGVLCRDCADKLSPWTKGRSLSVAQALEHLAYQEENRQRAEQFSPTREMGLRTRVLIDDAMKCFLVAESEDWKETDIIPLSCVKDAKTVVTDHRTELTYKNKDGKKVSYVPKRFDYTYDYDVVVRVDRPGFDTVSLRLNSRSVDGKFRRDCDAFMKLGEKICSALTEERDRPPKPMDPLEEFEDLLLSFEGLTEKDNGRPKPE